MKKYLFGLMALMIAVGLTAFSRHQSSKEKKGFTTMYFIYDLNTVPGSDAAYETPGNWTYSATLPPSCGTSGNATCYTTIDSDELEEFEDEGDDPEDHFAAYLAAQDGSPGTTYASAIEAVNDLRGNNKKAEVLQ